jgi:gliding motility-associated-like protein
VTLTSADGCAITDSVTLVGSAPPTVDLGVDTVYCGPNAGRRLDAYFPGSTYLWSTGQLDSVITATQTGEYSVTVTNACGTAEDAVLLTFFEYEDGYFIPNVFSPNGDGINDVFQIQAARPEEYQLFVYDRWGNLRFQTRNHQDGWEAQQEPEGVYYYAIHTTDCQGYLIRRVGWVTLLR